jgi:hypothetical protein
VLQELILLLGLLAILTGPLLYHRLTTTAPHTSAYAASEKSVPLRRGTETLLLLPARLQGSHITLQLLSFQDLVQGLGDVASRLPQKGKFFEFFLQNSCVYASRQLASHNSLHARKPQLAVLSALAASCRVSGTTGAGRHNAAVSKSARSPSLRLPQPRVPPASACRLATRHGAANSTESTTGAPQKMRRQDAATPGPTNQVFVGDAHGLRLPHKRFVTL